jgi:hypothetical protein
MAQFELFSGSEMSFMSLLVERMREPHKLSFVMGQSLVEQM